MNIMNEIRAAEVRIQMRSLTEAQYQALKDLLVVIYHDNAGFVARHRGEDGTDRLLLRAGMLRGIECVSEFIAEVRRIQPEDKAKEGGTP